MKICIQSCACIVCLRCSVTFICSDHRLTVYDDCSRLALSLENSTKHYKTEDRSQRVEGTNLDYLIENFETQLDKRNIVDFNISMLIIKTIRAKPLRYCNCSFPLGLIMDFRMGEKIIIMQHKAHTNIIIKVRIYIMQFANSKTKLGEE
ncbi:hypothetical protein T11_6788 [Trichinella zimbabwensis]|uniref:PiggyBac transposable element-derived protein domain-containing protein n=1 Tax=Trichinella zimbabwensis TaxID=268475 RepID=A0A0V1HDW0_9BILA|nr:hypothetical protein T11_6788 [Trichinella zimbabwensis]